MTWVAPQYTREQVNLAGKTRIDQGASTESRDAVLGVINNWRSSHSFPLNSFQIMLRNRARAVDPSAVIAQRLKRLSSIEAKLRRFEQMKFSQMQDIGGCRAVLRDVRKVDEVVQAYKESRARNPRRHEFLHEDDYISHPKEDGYRSIHYIYRYHSKARKHRAYNGLKVEIQIRSQLQHIWATAVETVGTFTGQALKADLGEQQWLRFFALMGSAIAVREQRPIVPNTPSNKKELGHELRKVHGCLKVEKTLEAWRTALNYLPQLRAKRAEAYFFLLFLDAAEENWTITVRDFKLTELLQAQEAYAAREKEIEQQPGAQAVLVSVEKISTLRRAYPNYFLDTRKFLDEVRRALREL